MSLAQIRTETLPRRPTPRYATAGVPGIGATARVIQGVSQEFRRLASPMPSLIAVRQGTKTLRCGGTLLRAAAGDIVVFPAHLAADVGNLVAEEGGDALYVAEFLAFEPDFLLAQASTQAASPPRQPVHLPMVISAAPDGLAQAFHRATEALTADPPLPPGVVAHRMAEPLVWLGDLLNAVLLAPQNNMTARLRALFAGDPARGWPAAEVARQVGASEATLRRKLAAEGTSFAEILRDVRMTAALGMIQTSALPITEVAAAVGYESPSRFAARFRDRFGMAPTAIRGHQRD